MFNMSFKVRFWGVRGSYPATGTDFALGGNTTCLEIEAGNHTIIFDAGTGIIRLGQYLAKKMFESKKPGMEISIFFTHYHQDHTQGLPFFPPLYMPNVKINFLGPKLADHDLLGNLNLNMYMPFFPVNFEETGSKKDFFNISEHNAIKFKPDSNEFSPELKEKFIELNADNNPDELKIIAFKNYIHPKGGSLYYRIDYKGKKVVFATDVEGFVGGDIRLIHAAKDVDYLIHDGQYLESVYANPAMPVQGYGHATPRMAADVAKQANAKKLIITHHDPRSNKEMVEQARDEARDIFPNTDYAYEIMEIDVIEDTITQFTGL